MYHRTEKITYLPTSEISKGIVVHDERHVCLWLCGAEGDRAGLFHIDCPGLSLAFGVFDLHFKDAVGLSCRKEGRMSERGWKGIEQEKNTLPS
jgi:hypothetical protein